MAGNVCALSKGNYSNSASKTCFSKANIVNIAIKKGKNRQSLRSSEKKIVPNIYPTEKRISSNIKVASFMLKGTPKNVCFKLIKISNVNCKNENY